jgi:PAS domain S-box-containing protein
MLQSPGFAQLMARRHSRCTAVHAYTMKNWLQTRRGTAWLIAYVLAIAVLAEGAIMMAIDFIVPRSVPYWVETLVDTSLLALILAAAIIPVISRYERRQRLSERAMNTASDGFWRVDLQGNLLEVNDGYCKLSGYERHELMTMRIDDVEKMQTRAEIEKMIAFICERGFNSFRTVHLRKDGTDLPLSITAVFDPREQIFTCFLRDDSSRVQTEDALRKQAARIQSLLDATGEGIYGVDSRGRCTFINRAALSMLGFERESDLLGLHTHSLFSHHRADGTEFPSTQCRLLHVLEQNENVHDENAVFWRRDGSQFPVEFWAYPVLEQGIAAGAVVSFVDISERKSAETRLNEALALLEDTFDMAAVGMAHVSLEGRMLKVNRYFSDLLGYSEAEMCRMNFAEFTFPDDLEEDLAHVKRLIDGIDRQYVMDKRYVRRDGQQVWVTLAVAVVRKADGTPDYFVSVAHDITAKKQAQRDILAAQSSREANVAKTRFLARMSHELRTPLNAVLGFTQILQLNVTRNLTPDQMKRLSHISTAGQHMLALIEEALDLAKVESGDVPLTFERVPVHELVTDAAALIADRALGAGLSVEVQQDDDAEDLIVSADRTRLFQVMLNLLSNAVKYNRPQGRILIELTQDEGAVLIHVADTGNGLTPDQVAHLFEPFNRLGVEKHAIEGTGIGLVITKRLIELMGGEILVKSTPGIGSTFSLALPLAREGASAAASPA